MEFSAGIVKVFGEDNGRRGSARYKIKAGKLVSGLGNIVAAVARHMPKVGNRP